MDDFARPAVQADVESLASLEADGRRAVADVERGGPQWLATHPELGVAGWSVRLVDPGWYTVVAGLDEVVLAYGAMRLPLDDPRRVARIETVYVHPDAREVGLGERIVGALMDTATAVGAVEIEASALPGDRETKNLYERAGIKARKIVVSVEL